MSHQCIPLLFRVLAHHAQGGPWQGTVSQCQLQDVVLMSLGFGELRAEEPGPCTLCFPR